MYSRYTLQNYQDVKKEFRDEKKTPTKNSYMTEIKVLTAPKIDNNHLKIFSVYPYVNSLYGNL